MATFGAKHSGLIHIAGARNVRRTMTSAQRAPTSGLTSTAMGIANVKGGQSIRKFMSGITVPGGLTNIPGAQQVRRIMSNIKMVEERIKTNAAYAFKMACAHILKESNKIVPVLTGHLKATGDYRLVRVKPTPIATVFYTAEYALAVHEDLDKLHGKAFNLYYAQEIADAKIREQETGITEPYWFYRGENQQAKFLETVIRTQADRIFGIIGAHVSITKGF